MLAGRIVGVKVYSVRRRHVKVTEHRTARDCAVCMRDIAETHYPDAALIRVVMDNLSTHKAPNGHPSPAPKGDILALR